MALGGTLHQHVQELPGRLRPPLGQDQAYGGALRRWRIRSARPGRPAAALLGGAADRGQLAARRRDRSAGRSASRVEALAADGTIEAVSVADAPGLALGVQWHPEWQVLGQSLVAAAVRGVRRRARATARRQRAGHDALPSSGLESTTSPRSSASSPTSTASRAARSSPATSSCARSTTSPCACPRASSSRP